MRWNKTIGNGSQAKNSMGNEKYSSVTAILINAAEESIVIMVVIRGGK